MFKTIGKIVWRTIAAVNLLAAAAMCISGYSGYFSPNSYPLLSVSGILFPVLLIANLIFLAFWICFHWKYVLIPLLALIICYRPIRLFCPFNFKQDVQEGCLKVISYNVHLYGIFNEDKRFHTEILDYFRNSNADIICVQESVYKKYEKVRLLKDLADVYPYCELTNIDTGHSTHYLYSKHPILYKEIIPYESDGNMSEAYLLDINGDTVLVVNNHLETYGLSMQEKEKYAEMVEGNKNVMAKRAFLSKIVKATKIRAKQAEKVNKYILSFKNMPIIVCGDFNDTPLSYVHHTICQGLTDTYVEAGNGTGFSYTNNEMYGRIDHIFCSEHFEPVASYVDSKFKHSDHYPIISYLKKKVNH